MVSNTKISFMNTEITTKVCPKCGRELPTSEFNKASRSKDGLQCWCRACQHEAQKSVPRIKDVRDGNPLSAYTPRQLMAELKRRGYDGELFYVQKIKLSTI